MNDALIKTCKNIEPDLLLLAKSEFIYHKRLRPLNNSFIYPEIAKWFVDFLNREEKQFFQQFDYISHFFQTSAAELPTLLEERFSHLKCLYMPNIT